MSECEDGEGREDANSQQNGNNDVSNSPSVESGAAAGAESEASTLLSSSSSGGEREGEDIANNNNNNGEEDIANDDNNMNEEEEKVILVMGACLLDRILSVSRYPAEDAKVRCNATRECGGGNAANTACALGQLCRNSNLFLPMRVKLLTKIGSDSAKYRLREELQDYRVDLSSPLFVAFDGSTTPGATIIVSEEDSTRTSFFTPGTCGELQASDVTDVPLDLIFHNVLHLHSDSYHTEAATFLAKEARKRGLSVSVDMEKKRQYHILDQLIDLATILFLTEDKVAPFLERKKQERYHDATMDLPPPFVSGQHFHGVDFYTQCVLLCHFFSDEDKEIIVTRANRGALHIQRQLTLTSPRPISDMRQAKHNILFTSSESNNVITANQTIEVGYLGDQTEEHVYQIHLIGPPKLNGGDIVDTTGCGDAFISFLLSHFLIPPTHDDSQQKQDSDDRRRIDFGLLFATWVAGKKMEGLGARSALPTSETVKFELGKDFDSIHHSLQDCTVPLSL